MSEHKGENGRKTKIGLYILNFLRKSVDIMEKPCYNGKVAKIV